MSAEKTRIAVIIGAGPAGLTAARELLEKTNIRPIVLEATGDIGGISKTVEYRGNRIDIGGHRFFSKSDVVNRWWRSVFPLQSAPARDERLLGIPPVAVDPNGADPEETDEVFLFRRRISRIFYRNRFFDYPISLSPRTVAALGGVETFRIGLSYLASRLHPVRPERSLEDFLINRFGRRLYETFFRDYTEKVWGIPCHEISREWGAQRIKGLSMSRTIAHALKKLLPVRRDAKNTETSLIEQFIYPKLGPGQLWEKVAEEVVAKGGEIRRFHRVSELITDGPDRVGGVRVEDTKTGAREELQADYVFSSMPVRDLVTGLPEVPPEVERVARGLLYRSFMTVGLLLRRLRLENRTKIPTLNGLIPDNWVYLQDGRVRAGRLQVFNNWSPYLVADPDTVWIGLEYFCDEGDDSWNMSDEELIDLSIRDMESIGLLAREDVLDAVRIRMPKAYPAYFGTYGEFDKVRAFLDRFENLFPIGRNGMHRYNNMDHSMLTAITAVDNLRRGVRSKENIWRINTEECYHEARNDDA